MEGTKSGSTRKVGGTQIDSETLKGVFTPLELPGWMVGKGGRESLVKGKRTVYGRWGVSYEALSEREALEGLKLVDELELSEVRRQIDGLASEVESVKSELKDCKEGIRTVVNELEELKEKPITKQTELFEIDGALELIRPIPVVIEEYEDEVVATFPEIEAFGVGLCEADAIVNLKGEITKIFFELEGISDDKLGRLPLSWKRALLKVVKEIGNSR